MHLGANMCIHLGYFVNDIKRKRALYLSLIRSQFEHCSPVWRPNNCTMMNKMESLQKKCIKWILSEDFYNYGTYAVYLRKCHQVRLLPLVKRFDYNDLILLYKVLQIFLLSCSFTVELTSS